LSGKISSDSGFSSKSILSVIAVIVLIGVGGVLFYLSGRKAPAEKVSSSSAATVNVEEKTPEVIVKKPEITEKVKVAEKVPAKKVENKKFPESITLPDGIPLEMVQVKAGSFIMGSPKVEIGRLDSEREHRVTLSKDFYIGKYEVTSAQFQAVMRETTVKVRGGDHPVNKVSWHEAKKFCEKLNEIFKDKLPENYQFDLPSEAQWEYACRAGTTTPFNYGSTFRRDNAWGIFDMHSNVAEWCNDKFGAYTDVENVVDPSGGSDSSYRIIRGGNSDGPSKYNKRSAYRTGVSPDTKSSHLGFRLALVPIQ
jgi:formylglycine-generating enzyme required for sulfatase activity